MGRAVVTGPPSAVSVELLSRQVCEAVGDHYRICGLWNLCDKLTGVLYSTIVGPNDRAVQIQRSSRALVAPTEQSLVEV